MDRRSFLRATSAYAGLLPCALFPLPSHAGDVASIIQGWALWLPQDSNEIEIAASSSRFAITDNDVAFNDHRWIGSHASLQWTKLALSLIVKYQRNPLRAARILALMHVAMHDALVRALHHGADTRAAM